MTTEYQKGMLNERARIVAIVKKYRYQLNAYPTWIDKMLKEIEGVR